MVTLKVIGVSNQDLENPKPLLENLFKEREVVALKISSLCEVAALEEFYMVVQELGLEVSEFKQIGECLYLVIVKE